MTRQTRRAWGHSGFSIIELAMVIAFIGVTTGIAVPTYQSYREKVRVSACVLEIGVIASEIEAFHTDANRYPNSLAEIGRDKTRDPWGNLYSYLNIADQAANGKDGKDKNSDVGKARKDHFTHPINTDYDLYSPGDDGKSTAPLTAKISQDDIVRASNGLYIGRASHY
jgi:general secretion pathway protein G